MTPAHMNPPTSPCEYMQSVKERAQCKLDWIISRYGDADGERLKPYYLEALINETIQADLLTLHCELAHERTMQ